MTEPALLALSNVDAFYGKSHILHQVSLSIASGTITIILGRNGAGKTTTLRSIMGLVRPRAGTINFKREDITILPPHQRFRRGLGYVPEGRRIFPHLTVGDNLRVAGVPSNSDVWTHERIFEFFPILRERFQQTGSSLSGGEQQMLAIARALVGNPKLLMLDEPSQGLAPRLVKELQSILRRLRGEGVTILMVEQNAKMALAVGDDVVVLSKGTVAFAGSKNDFHGRESELKERHLSV